MKKRLLKIWGALPLSGQLRWQLIYAGLQKFPVGVVGVILNGRGEILLFKHTYRGRYPWGLPAGWLKPWEAPEHAVRREIREETGMHVGEIRILTAHSAPDARRIDLVYHCSDLTGEFRPSAEVTEMRWYCVSELPPMLPSQYDMIIEILNILGVDRDV